MNLYSEELHGEHNHQLSLLGCVEDNQLFLIYDLLADQICIKNRILIAINSVNILLF